MSLILTQRHGFSIGGFSPNRIPGLYMWDAESLAAGAVSSWPDYYTATASWTQGTAGARPTCSAAAYNGRKTVSFDGGDQMTTSALLSLFQNVSGGTLGAVCKPTVVTAGEKNIVAWSRGAAYSNRAAMYVSEPTTGRFGAGGRRNDADSYAGLAASGSASTTLLSFVLVQYDWGNSNLTIYINGVQDAQRTDWLTDGNTSNTASQAAHIGASALASSNFFTGDICALVAAGSLLSADQIVQLSNWMRARWGTP